MIASVLGQTIDHVSDIRRIGDLVRANSLDLLQADHTLSGIDIALWDLLGPKILRARLETARLQEFVLPRLPTHRCYSVTTPIKRYIRQEHCSQGFRAAKFGWGPFGLRSVEDDRDQLAAAREGLGPDGILLVDAGTVWNANLDAARARLKMLQEVRATWLEEPFVSGALSNIMLCLARVVLSVMAGGEGCHNYHMANI